MWVPVPDVQVGSPSPACSKVDDSGKDLATDDLYRFDPVHLRDHPQHRLNPHRGQPAQLPDQLTHLGAIFPHVEGKHTRLLNRVVIPTLGLTMLAQDL